MSPNNLVDMHGMWNVSRNEQIIFCYMATHQQCT